MELCNNDDGIFIISDTGHQYHLFETLTANLYGPGKDTDILILIYCDEQNGFDQYVNHIYGASNFTEEVEDDGENHGIEVNLNMLERIKENIKSFEITKGFMVEPQNKTFVCRF